MYHERWETERWSPTISNMKNRQQEGIRQSREYLKLMRDRFSHFVMTFSEYFFLTISIPVVENISSGSSLGTSTISYSFTESKTEMFKIQICESGFPFVSKWCKEYEIRAQPHLWSVSDVTWRLGLKPSSQQSDCSTVVTPLSGWGGRKYKYHE